MSPRQAGFGLLGLAVLVGACDLAVKGLGLALAGLPLTALFGLLLIPLRSHLDGPAYWLGVLLTTALLVSLIDLLMQAWAFELHRSLGPFLALLTLPCLQLAQAPSSTLRAGCIFALLALLLGCLREVLGHAGLFAHLDWLLGPVALGWQLKFGADGIPLFALAPGGFILLGILIALWRTLSASYSNRP
ncbi:Rnf-Nqr domain containing protein [Metapseudomonas boanensis]|uniref:NADH:quinone oxidoreductase n=1 Tax=Metapseudomonas boanensis TaxID=2822138 RepID=A0ABS5XA91_9GAMM|nr:Rnf-Nqr domain containing protein [Pseudomonas boanensis]MBT8764608.1 NADH:quinone oxidoreductase [Pseudomonas boanensis]